MGAGGRASLSQRGRLASGGTDPALITPLYERLPRGPHRLARSEVILHQRARIHGAMIEAVARGGYDETSVKQVIGLAGVSRRAFYEQFANKQECFLATFDAIVHRVYPADHASLPRHRRWPGRQAASGLRRVRRNGA